jgi:recombination protein RecA
MTQVRLISDAINAMGKVLGNGVVYKPADIPNTKVRQYISTQCLPIDMAIGRRGIPCGRISMIYGPEACGKTTIAYHVLAEAQRMGGVAVLYDTEFSFDPDRAEIIGINPEELILVQDVNMEELFTSLDALIDKVEEGNLPTPVCVVYDSITATKTRSEEERKDKYNNQQPAQQAQVLSKSLRLILNRVVKNNIALVFLSQMRDNIAGYASDVVPGGRAVKFYSSLMLKVSRVGILKDGEESVGIEGKAKVDKNRLGPPFRTASYTINFATGLDRVKGYLDAAEQLGVVSKSGGWYEFTEDYRMFGETKFRQKDFGGLCSDKVIETLEKLAFKDVSDDDVLPM